MPANENWGYIRLINQRTLTLLTNENKEHFGLTNQKAFGWWPMRTENILYWPIRELSQIESIDQWKERTFGSYQSEHFQTLDLPTNDFPFLYNKYLIPGPVNLIESLASRIPDFFLSNLVLPSDWLVSWSFIKLRLVSFDHTCGEKYISLFWYAFWNSMISQVSQRTSDQ